MSDSRNLQTNKSLNSSDDFNVVIADSDPAKNLDPRLQLIQQSQHQFFCSPPDMVPVFATITDIEAWRQLANIKHGAMSPCKDGTT